MAYTSIYKGVIFIEGSEQTAEILGQVEYKKLFSFNSQIQTLDCVKDQLIEQTLALGGNAIIEFKYGQKSSGWFKSSLFSLDDNIKWYGNGLAAILPEETINKIFQKLNKV
ncbi:MAG: hypothetical protein IKM44_04905 [Clostridia bacterium]|nr:hypothetical protein [Clostridia bacterium]